MITNSVNPSLVHNDVIMASAGVVYITVKDERFEMAYLRNIQVDFEFDTATIQCIGMNMEAYKPTILRYSGTAEMYYNSSRIRDLVIEYQNSGVAYYHTIELYNEDPTSSKGKQSIIFNNVLITKGQLAKLSNEDGIITETIEFKCTGCEMRDKFTKTEGLF